MITYRGSCTALRLFLASCAVVAALLVSGCADHIPSQPSELAFDGQIVVPGPLAQPLAQELRVHVHGQIASNGAKVPMPNIRVAFALADQPDDAKGASLFRPETVTNAAGSAATGFRVGDKPGIYRVQAVLPDFPDVRPVSIAVLGGVRVTGAGQDGWVGKTLAEPLSVQIETAPGQFAPKDLGLVRFTLMGAPDGTTLSSGLRRTDDNGCAQTDIRLGKKQGRVEVGITLLDGVPGHTSLLAPLKVRFFSIDVWAVTVALLGGLALFLYGMKMMSESLQFVAGDKLRDLLNLLTTNRFMAVGAGAVITALIQSSSACTVMVVGFVNAGLMRLEQAIGVIMGANIGTTITAQIISLKLNLLALPACAVGVLLLFMAKRQRTKYWAGIIIGFGLLFLGMNIISAELSQLKESDSVISLFRGLHCVPGPSGFVPLWPFLKAVFCGLVVTLILQSSSATIGLLITIAAAGLIDPYASFGILLGDNIGTTITAILASLGTSTAARRAAVFHVFFNVVGCCIMVALNYINWPGRPGRPIFMELANMFTAGDVFRDGENLPRFIANAHTLFNISCTVAFIWFVPQFARLIRWVIASDELEDAQPDARRILEPHLLSTPSLAIQQVWTEVGIMLEKARTAQNEGYRALISDPSRGDDWNARARTAKDLEKETDELKTAITKYLSGISLTTLNENQSEMFPHLVRTVNDAERVADLGKHLSKLAKRINKRSLSMTPVAIEELNQMMGIVNELLELAEKTVNINADGIEMSGGGAVLRGKLLEDGRRLEKMAKSKASELRRNHEERHEAGLCDIKSGVVFLDVANSLARSAGCAVNIIQAACHTAGPVPPSGGKGGGNSASGRMSKRVRDSVRWFTEG